MIQKIVNEIHKCEDMEEMEFIQAIDDETIISKCIWGDIPLDVERIIRENDYEIYYEEKYMIINGETFEHYDGNQFIKTQNKKREGYDWLRNDYYKEFLEENEVVRDIIVIKIQPRCDVDKLYKEWKEKCKKDVTVGELIKELEKLDPNTIAYGTDYEYGEYKISKLHEVNTRRECPDCHERYCTMCNNRKMFERKYVFLS